VDPVAVERLQARHPDVTSVSDTAALVRTPHDVYAPCALGGALDPDTVEVLPARIVCGGANNQLATPEIAARLVERGVLYAPDYLVNAGGVIQVEDERHGLSGVLPAMPGSQAGFSFGRAKARTEGIFGVALEVFQAADAQGVSPAVAADRLAEERMDRVGRLATIRL
jgi:valine dehydrogenase (NAD+)